MRKLILMVGLAGMVLVVVIGCKANPSAEIDERLSEVDERLAQVDQRHAQIDAQIARLEAVYQQAQQKEVELNTREQQVKAVVEGLERDSFGDGSWEVGVDIRPGKYKTLNESGRCYWAKLDENAEVMNNEIESGPATVWIRAATPVFQSKRCGTWTRVGD